MATLKKMRDTARTEFIDRLIKLLVEEGHEVLQVASNSIAIPILLCDQTEDYIKVVVSIPTGSKDEAYDGYGEAEAYAMKRMENERKKEELAKKKEEKAR